MNGNKIRFNDNYAIDKEVLIDIRVVATVVTV